MSRILTDLNVVEMKAGLENKEFSCVELVQTHIDLANDNKDLNVYITPMFESALQQAKLVDEKIAKGQALRKLEGVPVGMKDLFCSKGVRTTMASKILENFVPAYESTVSKMLIDNGAIVLGKINLDQFAMGSSSKTSFFGAPVNPYKNPNREGVKLTAGGSSGGSSAGIAAGLFPIATGSDTAGSARFPAALTGVVGVKPTYGLCSRWGCIAFASSLDTPSSMARTVEDSALMLECMAGYDEKDSTSANVKVGNYLDVCKQASVKGVKIGLPKEFFENLGDDFVAIIEDVKNKLKEAGAEIVEVSLPHTKYALPAYYLIAPAEASTNLERYDAVRYGHRTDKKVKSLDDMYCKSRAEGFGDEVQRRILIGTASLSEGLYEECFLKASKIRRKIADEIYDVLKNVDCLLTPTGVGGAFGLEDKLSHVEMYMNDVFTISSNMAGVPTISLPVGKDKNELPLGMQIICGKFEEEKMFKIAKAMEDLIKFDNKPSKVLKK